MFYRIKGGKYIDSYCKSCKRLASSRWKEKHPERVKQHKKTAYSKNKSGYYDNHRKWISENPERRMLHRSRWLVNNRGRVNAYERKYTKSLQQLVIDGYGGRCSRCLITDRDVLVVDHVNNDGSKHRKRIKSQYSFYKEIVDNLFPLSFQVLCRNCNWKKQIERSPQAVLEKSPHRLRREVIGRYGHVCKGCGTSDYSVLTIDHVNNDGHVHGKTGRKLCAEIKQSGYPDTFQLLCSNCNWKKHVNGGVL